MKSALWQQLDKNPAFHEPRVPLEELPDVSGALCDPSRAPSSPGQGKDRGRSEEKSLLCVLSPSLCTVHNASLCVYTAEVLTHFLYWQLPFPSCRNNSIFHSPFCFCFPTSFFFPVAIWAFWLWVEAQDTMVQINKLCIWAAALFQQLMSVRLWAEICLRRIWGRNRAGQTKVSTSENA